MPPASGGSRSGHKDTLNPLRPAPATSRYPKCLALTTRGRACSAASKSSRNLGGNPPSFRNSLRMAPAGWFRRPCLSGALERTRSLFALRVRSHAADCPYGSIQEPRWSRTYKNGAPHLAWHVKPSIDSLVGAEPLIIGKSQPNG